jgi:hypothetical protein
MRSLNEFVNQQMSYPQIEASSLPRKPRACWRQFFSIISIFGKKQREWVHHSGVEIPPQIPNAVSRGRWLSFGNIFLL